MLQFIWIPSVILVGIFILALCFYFYSEYDCCICKRRTAQFHHVSDDVDLEAAVALKDGHHFEPVQPTAPPSIPSPSDIFHFKHADLTSSDLFSFEDGIPTLDLHRLAVNEAREITRNFLRAHSSTGTMVGGASVLPRVHGAHHTSNSQTSAKMVKIVTGRGMHSNQGVSALKPMVLNILQQRNLKHEISSKGGAILVHL
ncbi:uncharacterized protein LOC108670801 [Hyalella azteca]|uniref:Uncharacterized protein LOC108670801 n=1 Tax=Hyalella azteca TaxID=294128 RepID=A0A8B7NJF7_HYAAZ|nr:uncharacterized protein LOC108670801 [Hyalella azteca]